ncbi:hypothetical protein D5086_031074 [Populus alba]|uniref:Uncharacterized protein n=1 Tax=Populus alba TaxID=43335 RepID=A0ACC4AQ87_POPAL
MWQLIRAPRPIHEMKHSIIYDKGKVILGRLPDHRPVSPHAHLLFCGILVDFGTLLSIEHVEFIFHGAEKFER